MRWWAKTGAIVALAATMPVVASARGPEPVADRPSPETWAPPAPPPESGTGALVHGGLMMGAGTALMLPASYLLARRDVFGFALLLPGLGLAGGGTAVLANGFHTESRYRDWAREHDVAAPRGGGGLMAGGAWLAGAGIATTVIAAQLGVAQQHRPEFGLVLGASIAGGVTLFSMGLSRRLRWNRWRKSTSAFLVPSREGVTIGLSGKF